MFLNILCTVKTRSVKFYYSLFGICHVNLMCCYKKKKRNFDCLPQKFQIRGSRKVSKEDESSMWGRGED